jgi:LAO/AO transport system kinase
MRTDAILEGLDRRDTASLARAISLVENQDEGFEQVLAHVHERVGRTGSRRLGITGPPGAGKSTLTEQLTRSYRGAGLTVAVVAVDPTSPFSGGALLGDRIRMESVSLDAGVFIRSMATRGSMGGLAMTTEEVCDLLDAFGFDRILIETVGVGQTELDVARTAETTVLVLVPESGDAIQTLKAGVMEIADVFVINKSDRAGAEKLRQEIEVMLGIRRGNVFRHVAPHHGRTEVRRGGDGRTPPAGTVAWEPPVLATIASRGEGTAELIAVLDRHRAFLEASGRLAVHRRERLAARTRAVVDRSLRQWIWEESPAADVLARELDDMAAGRRSPYEVAAEILDLVKSGAAR